jgi:predicted enzyme related to lactoylglutathione lyase
MANNIPLIVYPVKDLQKSKAFFNTFLETEPYAESEYYVGYRVGDLEVGLDPNGSAVISYIDTSDINASLETLKQAGALVAMEPKDVGGGLMVAQVEIDGNVLGLRQQPK